MGRLFMHDWLLVYIHDFYWEGSLFPRRIYSWSRVEQSMREREREKEGKAVQTTKLPTNLATQTRSFSHSE